MPEFYVEGHTDEGVPYGPVHVLTTPIVERDLFEELMEGFDALKGSREEAEQAREDAWREAVMRKPSSVSPLEPS